MSSIIKCHNLIYQMLNFFLENRKADLNEHSAICTACSIKVIINYSKVKVTLIVLYIALLHMYFCLEIMHVSLVGSSFSSSC